MLVAVAWVEWGWVEGWMDERKEGWKPEDLTHRKL